MNTFDTPQEKFLDDQMEALLQDFFEGEMPIEVCELVDVPMMRRAPEPACAQVAAGSRLTTRVARALGTAAAVAGMLYLAWNIIPAHDPQSHHDLAARQTQTELVVNTRSGPTEVVSTGAREVTSAAPRDSFPSRSVGYSVTENVASLGLRKYATQQGRVEQRTHLRTTSVSFYEPKSGSQVQLQVPEIEIEILAAKDEGT